MSKLDFQPYTDEEVEVLLNKKEILSSDFKSVKRTDWFNQADKSIVYGIKAKHNNNETYNLSDGSRAVVFREKKQADKVCRLIRKQLKELQTA